MYLRRSTKDNEDKQVRSIQGQREELEEIVNQYGIKLVGIFEEKRSAFESGRKEFAKVFEMMQSGQANAMLVWHPNRIARNYADGGNFVQLMSEAKLQLVMTPHGVFEDSARDKEYLMTEFTRATRDSDDKSEAVKRGNKVKLRIGHIPSGRLIQGYIHVRNHKGEMINNIDPERFPLLQNAMRLVINQTHAPLEALDVLNNEWGYRTRPTKRYRPKPLSKSTWYNLMSDKKICGEIDRSEGEYKADYPKMIEPEEFDKIQIILGNTNRKRTPKQWTFAGNINCDECGASIINDEKWQIICSECKTKFHKAAKRDSCPHCKIKIVDMNKPKLLHYHWLRCGKTKKLPNGYKCSQKSLAIKDFEKQVDDMLEQIEIPKDFTEWAIAVLNEQSEREIDDRQTIENSLRKGLSQCQQQIDNLLMLKISPQNTNGQVISNEEYVERRKTLLAEKESFERQLEQQSLRQNDWLELTEKTFNFACYGREWFANGDSQQKRDILTALGLNLKLRNKKLLIDPAKPFQIIAEMKQNHPNLFAKFEPKNNSDNKAINGSFDDAIPSLLASLDEIRTYYTKETANYYIPNINFWNE